MTTKEFKILNAQLNELKKVVILQRIDMQASGKKPWEGKSKRIKNFITWASRPSEIHKFKTLLSAKDRAKLILPQKVIAFDPRELKTAQHNVAVKRLRYFIEHEDLTAQAITHEHYGGILPIVARCRRGYFIYDGNHRACINLLAGKPHYAGLIDLRDIDNIIKKLKTRK